MKKKKFPKTLYVKEEQERDPEDNFLIADEHFTNLSEVEESVEVAVYELVTIKYAVNKTELLD